MREQLCPAGLVDEGASRPQHPGDLDQRSRARGLARPEVEDDVEAAAREGQGRHVTLDTDARVQVHADEARGAQCRAQGREQLS
jgi:hypothetical protein